MTETLTATRWVIKTPSGFMGQRRHMHHNHGAQFKFAKLYTRRADAVAAATGLIGCYVHPVSVAITIPELGEAEAG